MHLEISVHVDFLSLARLNRSSAYFAGAWWYRPIARLRKNVGDISKAAMSDQHFLFALAG